MEVILHFPYHQVTPKMEVVTDIPLCGRETTSFTLNPTNVTCEDCKYLLELDKEANELSRKPFTLKVTLLDGVNTLIFRKEDNDTFFTADKNTISIGLSSFSFLIKFLVANKFLSAKVLEGILEEFNTN